MFYVCYVFLVFQEFLQILIFIVSFLKIVLNVKIHFERLHRHDSLKMKDYFRMCAIFKIKRPREIDFSGTAA